MSKAMMPRRFVNAANLDMVAVNDNLRQGADDVRRNLDRRYVYSTQIFSLNGVSSAAAQVLREYAVRRVNATTTLEIVSVELVLVSATGTAWTVDCSESSFENIVATLDGIEGYASSNARVSVPSDTSDVTFTLSASAAGTITSGHLVVVTREDRHGQSGSVLTFYTPTLITGASGTAGSVLDTELTALAAAVASDSANVNDVRCELVAIRGLTAGSSIVWRLPGGSDRFKQFGHYYSVAPVGTTTTFSINAFVDAVPGTGATSRTFTRAPLSGATANDPMTPASDDVVTISSAGGTTALAYALFFFA